MECMFNFEIEAKAEGEINIDELWHLFFNQDIVQEFIKTVSKKKLEWVHYGMPIASGAFYKMKLKGQPITTIYLRNVEKYFAESSCWMFQKKFIQIFTLEQIDEKRTKLTLKLSSKFFMACMLNFFKKSTQKKMDKFCIDMLDFYIKYHLNKLGSSNQINTQN